MLAKQQILDAIESLPDNISAQQLTDAITHLIELEEVRVGIADADSGKVYTPEQVREILLT